MKLKVVILADEDLRRHTNCGFISTEDMAAYMTMIQNDKAERIISPKLYFGRIDGSNLLLTLKYPQGQPISGCEETKTILKEKLEEAGVDAKLLSMGIAGMTSQILGKVRPAFFSRMMTPGRAMRKQLKHKKGILLHGPPGAGKTLIAKHICEFFNTKDPVVVSGPAFLSPLLFAIAKGNL